MALHRVAGIFYVTGQDQLPAVIEGPAAFRPEKRQSPL